jgi:hypothetical protein
MLRVVIINHVFLLAVDEFARCEKRELEEKPNEPGAHRDAWSERLEKIELQKRFPEDRHRFLNRSGSLSEVRPVPSHGVHQ